MLHLGVTPLRYMPPKTHDRSFLGVLGMYSALPLRTIDSSVLPHVGTGSSYMTFIQYVCGTYKSNENFSPYMEIYIERV